MMHTKQMICTIWDFSTSFSFFKFKSSFKRRIFHIIEDMHAKIDGGAAEDSGWPSCNNSKVVTQNLMLISMLLFNRTHQKITEHIQMFLQRQLCLYTNSWLLVNLCFQQSKNCWQMYDYAGRVLWKDIVEQVMFYNKYNNL